MIELLDNIVAQFTDKVQEHVGEYLHCLYLPKSLSLRALMAKISRCCQ